MIKSTPHRSLFHILLPFFRSTIVIAFSLAKEVIVEIQSAGRGPPVNQSSRYRSHVTLYIENSDGTRTPSGWSTRESDGADRDAPFAFQPGVNLIEGWTEGVLKMREGERSWLHVPSDKGYGAQSMGSPNGGGFYIPSNSDLLFDIEILGVEGEYGKQDL
ncbi:hypothetical protein ACHAXA_006119 [Cyclostephanos tholiformis]|uniref:peptidylprolyl isomerase n=1 Tax=Cyclostephanos tholiformis TaxID=382380 RepID=A0ABD3RAN2_9STRA